MSRNAVGVHDRAVSTPDDDDVTLASYEAGVDRYLEHSSPPGAEMERYLDRYAALVGSGRVRAGQRARVGRAAPRGPWSAGHPQRRHPRLPGRLRAAGHDAVHLDARTDDLGGPWDGLLADAVLLHLDRLQLEELLHRARRAVTARRCPGFHPQGGRWIGVDHRQARPPTALHLLARTRPARGPRPHRVDGATPAPHRLPIRTVALRVRTRVPAGLMNRPGTRPVDRAGRSGTDGAAVAAS